MPTPANCPTCKKAVYLTADGLCPYCRRGASPTAAQLLLGPTHDELRQAPLGTKLAYAGATLIGVAGVGWYSVYPTLTEHLAPGQKAIDIRWQVILLIGMTLVGFFLLVVGGAYHDTD